MKRTERFSAVSIRDAYKRYTPKAVILAGLNMTIQKGTIYGLLGSSGCGKTTLLSCIVGRQILDSGTLNVIYNRKSQVGYMPQDMNLSNEMTIMEALVFYGRIYMMEPSAIRTKAAELIEFLELPSKDKIIGNCSGGQQRRISMAVTLIHDPELLILDEPTVGLDPVLCERIMEFLVHLVTERDKTIVITTHYIEEARNSNTVGLMRGGILLAEESPKSLMDRYNCEHLEDAFLILSAQQETVPPKIQLYPPINRPPAPFQSGTNFNWKRFRTQFEKNFTWTYRNWAVTIFVCLVPTMTMYLCCVNDLKTLVTYPIATVLPEALNCSSDFKKIRPCLPDDMDFACRYVDILSKKYPTAVYKNLDSADYDARRGIVSGVVKINPNFTENLMIRLEEQSKTPDKIIEQSGLEVALDMTIPFHAILIVEHTYKSLQNLLEEICLACDINLRLTRIPLEFQMPIFGDDKGNYITSFLPAVMCPFVFYITFVYTSTALMMEKSSGLLERNQIAGLTLPEILAAQILIQLVVLTMQNMCIFSVVYLYFGSPTDGKFAQIYFLVFLCEIFGMSYGVFLALFMEQETMVSYTGIGTMLATFSLCGCMWPIEGQHWMISSTGKLLPLTYSAKGYFDIAMRGRNLSQVAPAIIMPIAGTIFISVVCIVLFKLKLINV